MKKLVEVISDFRGSLYSTDDKQIMTYWGLGKIINKQIGKKIASGFIVYMSKREFKEYEKRMRVKEVEKNLE